MELTTVKIEPPKDANVILGQAHFIKTAEDLYEALVNAVPTVKFGLGFCESSGPCLVRSEGNDPELKHLAAQKALELACGHSFLIILRNVYPINVLDKIKALDYNVLAQRPHISKSERVGLLLGTLARVAFRAA